MVLTQEQKYRQMEKDRKSRDKPKHIWATLSLTKEARVYNGKKIVSSSGAGRTEQVHVKE